MMLFATLACAALTVVTFLAIPRAAKARRLARLARPKRSRRRGWIAARDPSVTPLACPGTRRDERPMVRTSRPSSVPRRASK